MQNKGFEGWYFKHQKGDDLLALIPGRAESGAFIQLLSPGGAKQFSLSRLTVGGGAIRADRCLFSRQGCQIDLPGVQGAVRYGRLTPLRSDIMGPFRFLPMECRHGILSMAHPLQGSLTVDGVTHRFDGGTGYLEKDSGTSFPRSYLWVQCNIFPLPCAITLSVAQIPFGPLHFQGCICALVFGGREYRLATYTGVRIHLAEAGHICLSQGELLLEVDCRPHHTGQPLRAPVRGQMSATIRESCNAAVRVRLWEKGKPVFDLSSDYAVYEFVPPAS